LDQAKAGLRSALNCVEIGIVESFRCRTDRNRIHPRGHQTDPKILAPEWQRALSGAAGGPEMPRGFCASGGGFALTFPIAAGDERLVLFQ